MDYKRTQCDVQGRWLDRREGPQRCGLVGTGAEKGKLWGVPAAWNDFVLMLSHHHTRQRCRQVPCTYKGISELN